MRITVTLDDNVAANLRQEMERTGTGLSEVVNACVRRGLNAPSATETKRPFVIQAQPMGLKTGMNLDRISGVLELLDGPTRR